MGAGYRKAPNGSNNGPQAPAKSMPGVMQERFDSVANVPASVGHASRADATAEEILDKDGHVVEGHATLHADISTLAASA